jgi:GntR family histidine utilization transcriptional repressor
VPGNDIPLYQMVKQHILELIQTGEWEQGKRLPSENELVRHLSVSRMTVHRALRELASEGHVQRVSGSGTFVGEKMAQSHPLEIRNIAEEITSRGHAHYCEVITLETVRATSGIAVRFEFPRGERLYHSVIIHLEDGNPIQYEERHVLPEFAPDYTRTDFASMTTYEYMMKQGAFEDVEQIVQAAIPDEQIRSYLRMQPGEPCLILLRRTWVGGRVVTSSRLQHPASRFQFSSRIPYQANSAKPASNYRLRRHKP